MTEPIYTFTRSQLNTILSETIGLFLEYRDVHGKTEENAHTHATSEVIEGLDATLELVGSAELDPINAGMIIHNQVVDSIFDIIRSELIKAQSKHKPFNSYHEAYAIIYEELCEYWDQVRIWPKQHDVPQMQMELVHICVTSIRTILDVILRKEEVQ